MFFIPISIFLLVIIAYTICAISLLGLTFGLYATIGVYIVSGLLLFGMLGLTHRFGLVALIFSILAIPTYLIFGFIELNPSTIFTVELLIFSVVILLSLIFFFNQSDYRKNQNNQ